MALKEVYHTVASVLDMSSTNIPSGRIVTLNTSYQVDLPAAQADVPIGVAGDTKATAFSNTVRNPESAALVTGANGANTRWSQNRVADNYDETLASGKMTVYHGAGEFWTDQYAAENTTGGAITWAAADSLHHTFGTNADVPAGSWTNQAGIQTFISGVLLGAPQALPSGVPGTDVEGSISFGTFIHLRLWH